VIRCRLKPYIQPFERRLAIEELKSLSGALPIPVDGSEEKALVFDVQSDRQSSRLAEKLAYWERIEGEAGQITRQVYLEATANLVRNGIPVRQLQTSLPFSDAPPLPNRRCLRYGTHGIHEYRGKFFPQLVRALINIGVTRQNAIVADPMCGSGTTLVEALVAGHSAIGLDLNPLSVLISKVKCSLLSASPKQLARAYEEVRAKLLRTISGRSARLAYFTSLPGEDQEYLRRWIAPQVLGDLDRIMTTIASVHPAVAKDLLRLSLSNILRRVSWQKDDDLRVRKEVRLDEDIDPIREFLEELGRSVRIVVAFLQQNQGSNVGSFRITEGDAREASREWSGLVGKVDAIVTSPPYATALPYLDTDRLSLIYLKLLTRPSHRKLDQEMIGNREISNRIRDLYWRSFKDKRSGHPKSVVTLIEEIDQLNKTKEVGFRRQNLASLLAKYFTDMRTVFLSASRVLRKGAPAYVVIGNNHTTAGGKHVRIETVELLADIARVSGFEYESRIPMEMLVSRDIFKRNAVASEYILCFRRTA
jgi:DNA modification methylase